jgi:sugar/nucleoside kinase (ribokinase family)
MAETELELLCIGNALVDVFAQGDEDVDVRYGITRPVQHIGIEKLREILTVLPEFTPVSGGGAANTAKIAGLLEGKVQFIGAVGRSPEPPSAPSLSPSPAPGSEARPGRADQFGRLFEQHLAEAGVALSLSLKPSPTGICLILQTSGGETRIAAAPSAARELSIDDIDEDALRRARVVVIDGFMLDRRELVLHILDLADKYGTVAALDVGSTGIVEGEAVEIAGYLRRYPLILFMNEDESRSFYRILSRHDETDAAGEGVDSENHAAHAFFREFTAPDLFPILVIKLGKRGAVVFAGGNCYREETIPVIPLETTGAGDAFCAAFLTAWVRGRSLSECAALGNRAARIVLDKAGTQVDGRELKHLAKLLKQ